MQTKHLLYLMNKLENTSWISNYINNNSKLHLLKDNKTNITECGIKEINNVSVVKSPLPSKFLCEKCLNYLLLNK